MKSLRSITTIFSLVLLTVVTMLTSCYMGAAPPTAYVNPQATMGYQGSTYGAYVTDQRGQQFFVDYVIFNSLMSSGGYNAVDNYYYSNPHSTHIHVYTAGGFKADNSPRAQSYRANFNKSYTTANANHTVYTPPVSKPVTLNQPAVTTNRPVTTTAPTPSPASSTPVNLTKPPSSPTTSTVALNKPTTTSSTPVNLSKPSAPTPSASTSSSRPVSFSSRSSGSSSFSSSSRSTSSSSSSGRRH